MRLDDLDPSKNARDHGQRRRPSEDLAAVAEVVVWDCCSVSCPCCSAEKWVAGQSLLIGGSDCALHDVRRRRRHDDWVAERNPAGSGTPPMIRQEEQFAGQCSGFDRTDLVQIVCRQWISVINRQRLIFMTAMSARKAADRLPLLPGPFIVRPIRASISTHPFFVKCRRAWGAKGDFAQAYVIAHEVGHHIQNLTGVANQVRQAQSRASKAEGNALQVRMELQADCYAGVWAAQNAERMEPGDVEEGLNAAHAIGDDTLMRNAGQRPIESMFTHGSSEQRMTWLRKGMQTGDPAACDTFARGAVR